jgi:hypothetical protein
VPGKIGDCEEDIPEFGLEMVLVARRRGKLVLELVRFLADFFDHRERIVPIEADAARAALQLDGASESGEGNWHIVEKGRSRGPLLA